MSNLRSNLTTTAKVNPILQTLKITILFLDLQNWNKLQNQKCGGGGWWNKDVYISTCNQHDYIWPFLQDKNACFSHLYFLIWQRPSCCVCFIFDNFFTFSFGTKHVSSAMFATWPWIWKTTKATTRYPTAMCKSIVVDWRLWSRRLILQISCV